MLNLLNGLRVVDLTTSAAGRHAMRMMRDLGAEVITVAARDRTAPVAGRAITLDATAPDGRETLDLLIESAHALVEDLPAATAAAIGVDFERLRQLHPSLVYCHVERTATQEVDGARLALILVAALASPAREEGRAMRVDVAALAGVPASSSASRPSDGGDTILREIGMGDGAIAGLIEAGVLQGAA
jgi:hypothetical protein